MTYPSLDFEAYEDWTPPEHECNFIENRTVEAGVFEDGVLRIYEIQNCTQCDNTNTIRTDRIADQPRK